MRTTIAMALLVLTAGAASAIDADECRIQRAPYPKNWKDVAQDKGLFDCRSHYEGALRVKLGPNDDAGRALMSIVALKDGDSGPVEQPSKRVYRIWLDKEQAERLRAGQYFATIVRKEASCWIRGDLDEDTVFFMDNADPPADGARPGAGSFYNKAPRFSVFQGNAYTCEPTK